jgi:hypothetical protein
MLVPQIFRFLLIQRQNNLSNFLMKFILQNKHINLTIDSPGYIYRGSRFDWTGKITQVIFKQDFTFCTTESTLGMDLENKGQGFYNEFGITDPIGFDECSPGDKFPKLGVGLLLRPDEDPYNFFRPYIKEPFKIEMEESLNEISFTVDQFNCNGYSSILHKRIYLQDYGFTINYSLKNTGSKNIQTSEYCHNFIAINYKEMGMDYELTFPMPITFNRNAEIVNTEMAIKISQNKFKFQKTPYKEFFFGSINPDKDKTGNWQLIHKSLGAGIREIDDFIPSYINVWGSGHVICPELFCGINLAPGQIKNWSRSYEFFTI